MLIVISVGVGYAAYHAGGGGGNILFMALALMMASIVLSGLLSIANIRRLRWRLRVPASLRAGTPALLELELFNAKKILPTYSLTAIVQADSAPKQESLHLPLGVAPKGRAVITWELTPLARGHDLLSVIALQSSYPFGFLKKRFPGHAQLATIVLPARIDYVPIGLSGQFRPRAGHRVRRPGSGEQLYNIRPYQAGDHQRLVHWKATARSGKMMVKQLMEEQQDGYTLVVQTTASLWTEAPQLERLISLAASLAEDLFARQQLVAYALNSDQDVPVCRQQDLRQLLEALATCAPHRELAMPADGPRRITFRPNGKERVDAVCNGQLAAYAE
jgi:uncharacterized protein (DUF58 family)